MRRTRLASGKGLTRRTQLRAKTRKVARHAKTVVAGPSMGEQRETVYARAGGRCDLCSLPLTWIEFEAHHRLKRSQGGDDSAPNLLALHARCHHDRVHGEPAWSYEHGFMVRRGSDPTSVAVLRHGTRREQPGEHSWTPALPPIPTEEAS